SARILPDHNAAAGAAPIGSPALNFVASSWRFAGARDQPRRPRRALEFRYALHALNPLRATRGTPVSLPRLVAAWIGPGWRAVTTADHCADRWVPRPAKGRLKGDLRNAAGQPRARR